MEHFPKKILSVVHPKKFSIDKNTNYHLCISIGQALIKFCCIDKNTQACLLLGVYELPVHTAHQQYIKSLEQFYNQDFFLLKKNWYSVTLTIENQKFTLVPHLLLSKQDLSTYMHVAVAIDSNDEIISFTHPLAKVSVVFSENSQVLDWFRQRYTLSNFHIIHQANAIIVGCQTECLPKTDLFLWLSKDYFYVVVHNKSKLLYCNLFTYQTWDDLLSYLSAVIQIMQLKPSTCRLVVGGFLEKKSLIYSFLKKYFPKIILKTKIDFVSLTSSAFKSNNIHAMLYFDLMSSFLFHNHSKE